MKNLFKILIGIFLTILVSGNVLGQNIYYETTTIVPGEEYLIGLVDGNNVYLAVNYAPTLQNYNYYTSAEGANWYGYTVKAQLDGTNLVGIEEKYGVNNLIYCTWIFEGNTQDGYIIHSGRENYYLASWSSTSYDDLYPASYSSNATKWIYENNAFYRIVNNTKRYMQYYNLTSANYTGSYTGPHMRVTGTTQQNNIKLYTKDFPLPITLISFNAVCIGHYSNIYWTTATETNNEYFILEHSIDAKNFKEVTRIPGAGTSIEPNDYEYIDYNAPNGDNYYRLIQVDYDGTNTTSEIIYVNCKKEVSIGIYPNPSNGIVNFANVEGAIIEVYSMTGQIITIIENANVNTSIDLSNVANGNYVVRIIRDNTITKHLLNIVK